jgi:hypothetical protein
MSETAVGTAALQPEAQIVEMIMAQLGSRLIHLAATLRLPDHMAEGPRSAEELASVTGTHASALYRIMRTMAAMGVFTEGPDHRFALTPIGAALKSGTPSHATALLMGGDFVTRSLDHLLFSAQTGTTAFSKAFGKPLFDWLSEHPGEASLFNETMVGVHGAEPAAVASAYDFSAFGTIADIGGSTGNLLATILRHHPAPRGILYDLPHVVRDAPAFIRQRGLSERLRIEPGSFFDRVPAGADAYILSHIIHDWNEQQCLTILGNCRRAMNPGGRVLLVEMVIPEGDVPHPGKLLDIVMLAIPGGEERTAAQYAELLGKAGLRMTRVVPTASLVSVVEAVPA